MVNPGGNRLLNSDIHELALYLIGHDEVSKTYYKKKKSEGKTSKETIRCFLIFPLERKFPVNEKSGIL